MEDLIDSIVNEAQKMRKDDFQDQKAFDFLFAMQVLLDTAKLLNDDRKEMLKQVSELKNEIVSAKEEIRTLYFGDGTQEPGILRRMQYYTGKLKDFGTDATVDLDRRLREKAGQTLDEVIRQKLDEISVRP